MSRTLAFLRRFSRHRLAVVGLAIYLALVLVALFAPLLAPYDPAAQNLELRLQGPSLAHPFGLDSLGRDIFSRVVLGARQGTDLVLLESGDEGATWTTPSVL